ncbi:MAG: ArnT family glycosyltransferase [Patescibacteria group bacterium]
MTRKKEVKIFFKKRFFSIIFFAFFLIFFFSLHINSFSSPWERDEGEYAYSAWLMERGETPYIGSFIQKPPLIIYTYYLTNLISPSAVWPPRLLGFLFTLATCILLSLVVKKLYGFRAAWLALWSSPLILLSPYLTALSANTEKFMLLPLVGLIALFIFYNKKEKVITYFLAGVLASLAILYKPIAFIPSCIIILYWLVNNYVIDKKISKFFLSALYIFLGAFVTTALSLLYFVTHGAIVEVWRQVVVYNFSYVADTKKYFPERFFHYSQIFWNNWWPIILLALTSFFVKQKYYLIFLILLIASLLSIITTTIGHYYLLLAPLLILLAAGSFSVILEKIKIKEEVIKNLFLFFFIIFIVSVSFCRTAEQFFLNPNTLSIWIYGDAEPFVSSRLMAEKIGQLTAEGDNIFVAGSESQIYYFSQRKSSSKFNIVYPLTIDTPQRLEYQNLAISDLKNRQPAAIILPLSENSGLLNLSDKNIFLDYLDQELRDNYNLLGATTLDIDGNPAWVESKEIIDIKKLDMLLYIKKR